MSFHMLACLLAPINLFLPCQNQRPRCETRCRDFFLSGRQLTMNNDILVLARSLPYLTLQRTPSNLSARNKCRCSDNAVTTVVPGENDLPFLPSFSLPYLSTPHKQARVQGKAFITEDVTLYDVSYDARIHPRYSIFLL